MNQSTPTTDRSPVIPAARSGLTDLKNVYGGHGGGDSTSNTASTTDYGYGDDSDSEDDSPGGAYGYGGPGSMYGYGGSAKPGGVYGYGDDDAKGGDGDDEDNDYGYGDDKDAGNPAGDYGYGDEDASSKPIQTERPRPRLLRRNSCVIHKEDNPLAVAEYLLGGPPRMSDRDMDMELNKEGAIST
jgi:hypothetical protein